MNDDQPKTATNAKPAKDPGPTAPARPRDVIPVKVLHLRADRPIQLSGGHAALFSITTNEFYTVEFHPAQQMYRVAYTPRAGTAVQPWERMIPASWGSFERAPL